MREFQGNLNQNASHFIQNKAFEMFVSKILAICRYLNMLTMVIQSTSHGPALRFERWCAIVPRIHLSEYMKPVLSLSYIYGQIHNTLRIYCLLLMLKNKSGKLYEIKPTAHDSAVTWALRREKNQQRVQHSFTQTTTYQSLALCDWNWLVKTW